MPQPQKKCAEQPADATCGEVIVNYDPDIDYEPEGSDPNIKAVHKEEENSDAEYVKMELP